MGDALCGLHVYPARQSVTKVKSLNVPKENYSHITLVEKQTEWRMRIIIAINVISNATEIVDDCGLAYLKEEDANSNSV